MHGGQRRRAWDGNRRNLRGIGLWQRLWRGRFRQGRDFGFWFFLEEAKHLRPDL
jgi:hypothetical protein